jgi:hypothetical protein
MFQDPYVRSKSFLATQGAAKIIFSLKVEPEARRLPEKLAESDRHFGRDSSLAQNNLGNRLGGDSQCSRERILRHAQRLEVIVQQNLTRMDWTGHIEFQLLIPFCPLTSDL